MNRLAESSLRKSSLGLRAIAVFEAAKGALVLLLGFGVLKLAHKNLDDVAEHLLHVLHASPAGKLSHVFLDLANHISDQSLWLLAIVAFVYAAMRGIVAYGLWRERTWAQAFELLVTGGYLPVELYWLSQHATPLKLGVLAVNLLILLYLLNVVRRQNFITPHGGERLRKA
jgi:uncharacterized membrane protein (DUF2068 family)